MYFVEYILYHLSVFSDSLAYKGLGNRQPPPEFYWVASDLEKTLHKYNSHQQSIHSKHAQQQHSRHDVEYNIEPGDIIIEGSGGDGDSWFPVNQKPIPPPPTHTNKARIQRVVRHSI